MKPKIRDEDPAQTVWPPASKINVPPPSDYGNPMRGWAGLTAWISFFLSLYSGCFITAVFNDDAYGACYGRYIWIDSFNLAIEKILGWAHSINLILSPVLPIIAYFLAIAGGWNQRQRLLGRITIAICIVTFAGNILFGIIKLW